MAVAALAHASDALHRRRGASEDHGRPGEAGQRQRRVAGLKPRRAVALVGGVVLFVDHDQPDRRRAARSTPCASPRPRQRSPARMRRHSSARSPSPSPECRIAISASRSARRRSTSGIASAISGTRTERRPAGRDRLGDRLGVDRRLARARDAFEQQRRRVAASHRGQDRGEGRRLRRVRAEPPAGSPAGRPAFAPAAGAAALASRPQQGRAGRGSWRSPTRAGSAGRRHPASRLRRQRPKRGPPAAPAGAGPAAPPERDRRVAGAPVAAASLPASVSVSQRS